MAGQVLTVSAERHREQFDQLVAQVAAYNPDVDRDLLERAYRFASEAHEHQQRRSGEDFILHPLGVALILAELRTDDASIAAGIPPQFLDQTASN
jgi:(p)ppGpp synthase/HD superfamily hydrolase